MTLSGQEKVFVPSTTSFPGLFLVNCKGKGLGMKLCRTLFFSRGITLPDKLRIKEKTKKTKHRIFLSSGPCVHLLCFLSSKLTYILLIFQSITRILPASWNLFQPGQLRYDAKLFFSLLMTFHTKTFSFKTQIFKKLFAFTSKGLTTIENATFVVTSSSEKLGSFGRSQTERKRNLRKIPRFFFLIHSSA